MATADAVFRDRYGLHPRAANRIRETAAQYQSKITLEPADGGSAVVADSMLGLVSSGIRTGDRLHVIAEGPDEQAALDAMTSLLDGGVCHP